MRKFIIFLIISAFLISSFSVYAEPAAPPNITAPSAILIDAKTGKVLYEKNADTKMYPASITKIMTGLLALERGNLEDVVTVGPGVTRIERGSSQISLIPGEQLTLEQLLYALMLESANDAAIAIAEHISGSVPDFADLMNQRALELGATNTHFVNPNGLHHKDHTTTARDMALIAKHAMTLPKFREVVATVKYNIPPTNKQEARNYITNSNKMIWKNYKQYRYEPAIGIKTGYTVHSKHTYVAGAAKEDTELISVILGLEGANMYDQTKALFEYGFANFKYHGLLQKNQVITTANVKVKDKTETVNLLSDEDYALLLSVEEANSLDSKITLTENIKAPIHKGDVLGTVLYTLGGSEIKQINLISADEVAAPKKQFYKWWWLWLIIIFLIYRTLVMIGRKRRRRMRMRRTVYVRR